MQLYTGVPGSGKSYRLVYDVDRLLNENPDITVIANIKGLKLPHLDFDDFLLECVPEAADLSDRLEKFFDYEHQSRMNEKFGGPVMYVLDECQSFFPRRKSLPNTELYFQKHRHLGHHVLMATQACKLLNQNLVALMELEYQAVRRSASLFGELRYRTKSPQSNEVISTVTLRPKKRIFELYRSFENDELKRPRRELLRKLWPVLLLPVAVYLFYLGLPKAPEPVKPKPVPKSSQAAALVGTENIQYNQARSTTRQVEELEREIEGLKRKLNDKERVFLTVVKVGDRRLTIDPDTNAVVEMGMIRKPMTCIGDLRCYYDRPVNSGVKVADTSEGRSVLRGAGGYVSSLPSSSSMGQAAMQFVQPQSDAARQSALSSSSFVEPSMVPPPQQ